MIFRRIEQLDQEVKTKVYDELHNAKGINFIWEATDTRGWSSVSSGYAQC